MDIIEIIGQWFPVEVGKTNSYYTEEDKEHPVFADYIRCTEEPPLDAYVVQEDVQEELILNPDDIDEMSYDDIPLDTVTLAPETTLYKTMDYFYSEEATNEYNNTKGCPSWYGSLSAAKKVLPTRFGGIHAFRLLRDGVFLIINRKTIKFIVYLINSDEFPATLTLDGRQYTKDKLLDICTLASCEDIKRQAEVFMRTYGYDGSIWLFENSDLPHIPGDYFAIVKSKGLYNFAFAFLIQYIATTYIDGVNGYIIPRQYSPYTKFLSGGEEVVVFLEKNLLIRDVTDVNDWTASTGSISLPIVPRESFIPNFRSFGYYNRNFFLNKLYDEDYKPRQLMTLSRTATNKIVVIDVNNFISYNRLDTVESNMSYLIKFLTLLKPDIAMLLNARSFDKLHMYRVTRYKNDVVLESEKLHIPYEVLGKNYSIPRNYVHFKDYREAVELTRISLLYGGEKIMIGRTSIGLVNEDMLYCREDTLSSMLGTYNIIHPKSIGSIEVINYTRGNGRAILHTALSDKINACKTTVTVECS